MKTVKNILVFIVILFVPCFTWGYSITDCTEGVTDRDGVTKLLLSEQFVFDSVRSDFEWLTPVDTAQFSGPGPGHEPDPTPGPGFDPGPGFGPGPGPMPAPVPIPPSALLLVSGLLGVVMWRRRKRI